MAKRQTIGEDPLALVVPEKKTRKKTHVRAKTAPEVPKVAKERLTLHLTVDLIDWLKNAVYWTPGLTLAGFGEEALSKALDGLEKKNGKPFPKRTEELKGGRPMK